MRTWIQRLTRPLLLGINLLVTLLLLASYLAAWVPPSTAYWFSILAIAYPWLLFSNLFFAFWWLYQRERYVYGSLFAILLGGNHLFTLVHFQFGSVQTAPNSLWISSYNVRYFNATVSNSKAELEAEQDAILEVLAKQPMDIFCGQEASGKKAAYNERAEHFLTTKLGLKHQVRGGKSSLMIASKYPILKKGVIDFPNSYNGALYADIQYQNQTIRVYAFHLQSVGLGQDEHELFKQENLSHLGDTETQATYKRIGRKLKGAFLQREEQANFIVQHIKKSPYPVLVCGDMNDTPTSYAYHQFAQDLQDAFCVQGSGLGSTYAGRLPFLRIDYVFADSNWRILNFETGNQTTSDHYPIRANLKLQ